MHVSSNYTSENLIHTLIRTGIWNTENMFTKFLNLTKIKVSQDHVLDSYWDVVAT